MGDVEVHDHLGVGPTAGRLVALTTEDPLALLDVQFRGRREESGVGGGADFGFPVEILAVEDDGPTALHPRIVARCGGHGVVPGKARSDQWIGCRGGGACGDGRDVEVAGEGRVDRGAHDEFGGRTPSLQGFDQTLHFADLKIIASRDTDQDLLGRGQGRTRVEEWVGQQLLGGGMGPVLAGRLDGREGALGMAPPQQSLDVGEVQRDEARRVEQSP